MEQVLGFDSTLMQGFTGFSNNMSKSKSDKFWWRARVLPSLYFRSREHVETDPTFKQVIPYISLYHNGTFFTYTRAGGGEKRLCGKRALGVGGHVNPIDVPARGFGDMNRVLEQAVKREMEEELGPNLFSTFVDRKKNDEGWVFLNGLSVLSPVQEPFAFIYDASDGVGSVHFGLSIVFGLRERVEFPASLEIQDGDWVLIDDLLKMPLEGWAKAVIEAWRS